MFAIIACGHAVTLGSPVSPRLELRRGIVAIVACEQVVCLVTPVSSAGVPAWYVCSQFMEKLSPWGLQCLHPWSSSVVCLQSLLVDKLSPWGLQCSSVVCLVSSVSTPGVPACYVCNHCLWESCQCGVSSVSAYGVSAFLFITCGKLPPWRLQCPNPSISSVVCLQSLLVGQLSSWGLQRLRPCREFQRGTLAISLVNNLSPRNFQQFVWMLAVWCFVVWTLPFVGLCELLLWVAACHPYNVSDMQACPCAVDTSRWPWVETSAIAQASNRFFKKGKSWAPSFRADVRGFISYSFLFPGCRRSNSDT